MLFLILTHRFPAFNQIYLSGRLKVTVQPYGKGQTDLRCIKTGVPLPYERIARL